MGGLDHGHDRDDRRGGSRDRRGRKDRRDYERERERERLLEDEAVGPFASRFQSLEEMRGQVCYAHTQLGSSSPIKIL